MDKVSVVEIIHTDDPKMVNKYLETGWQIIETAPGKDENGKAYILYSIGWTDVFSKPTHPDLATNKTNLPGVTHL